MLFIIQLKVIVTVRTWYTFSRVRRSMAQYILPIYLWLTSKALGQIWLPQFHETNPVWSNLQTGIYRNYRQFIQPKFNKTLRNQVNILWKTLHMVVILLTTNHILISIKYPLSRRNQEFNANNPHYRVGKPDQQDWKYTQNFKMVDITSSKMA